MERPDTNPVVDMIADATIGKASDRMLGWGEFFSKLGPVAFFQVLIAFLIFMGFGWAVYTDYKRNQQMVQMQALALDANTKMVNVERESAVERERMSQLISQNTLAINRMESAVIDKLLGLKRDADTIKKDIKDVKEGPPKDIFGARPRWVPPLVGPPEMDVLPHPRPVDD